MLKFKMVKVKCFSALLARWGQVFLAFWLMAEQISSAQILPANRTPGGHGNWNNIAGVPGGIPAVTNIYTTISAGASESTIQSAINSCPSNQVVLLSPGTYSLSSTLTIGNNGVVLRGTIINGTNASILSGSANPLIYLGNQNWYSAWDNQSADSTHVNWTGNFTQGTTNITVSSTSGLDVGELVYIDIKNDTNVFTTGHCSSQLSGSYTSVANNNVGQDRWQNQLNHVIAINGTTLTFSEPVYMPNYGIGYTNGLVPQIWWCNGNVQPTVVSGVENLNVVQKGTGDTIAYMYGCYACWLKNVGLISGAGPQNNMTYLYTWFDCRCEVRHCTFQGPLPAGSNYDNDDYAGYLQAACGLLFTDNITDNAGVVFQNGGEGNVFSYNYFYSCRAGAFPYLEGLYLVHGGNPAMTLVEGNIAPKLEGDNCWGGSEYNTIFRNYFRGLDPPNAAQYDFETIEIQGEMRNDSVIGNVLGTPSLGYGAYEDSGSSYVCHDLNEGGSGRIYWLGEVFTGTLSPCSESFDATTYNTLIRAVNYDALTSTNSGIVGYGYTPSSLPASLYLTSAPTNFGILSWPPVDPNNPAYSSSITNIPAGYRFVYGVDPPAVAGGVTASTAPTLTGIPMSWYADPQSGSVPTIVSIGYTGIGETNCVLQFGDGTSFLLVATNHVLHTYTSTGVYPLSFYLVAPGGSAYNPQNLGYSITITNSP